MQAIAGFELRKRQHIIAWVAESDMLNVLDGTENMIKNSAWATETGGDYWCCGWGF